MVSVSYTHLDVYKRQVKCNGFRKFHFKKLRRYGILVAYTHITVNKVLIIELKPGYIDRHGKGGSTRVKQTPEPTADLLVYILVKAVNHIFSLEYRDEAVRRNDGAGLGLPADQSLCTADFSCCKVVIYFVVN